MQLSGEPVLGCLETQSKVEFSDTPIQSEGVDPLPMEVTSHNFADGAATQLQPLVFSTEAALPTHESSQGPFSQSLGAPWWPLKERPVLHARQDLLEQC